MEVERQPIMNPRAVTAERLRQPNCWKPAKLPESHPGYGRDLWYMSYLPVTDLPNAVVAGRARMIKNAPSIDQQLEVFIERQASAAIPRDEVPAPAEVAAVHRGPGRPRKVHEEPEE